RLPASSALGHSWRFACIRGSLLWYTGRRTSDEEEATMDPTAQDRLSKISTVWTLLEQAHRGPGAEATAAQQQILQRYGGAVYRYCLAAARDGAAAAALAQEFGLALVRGKFRGVDPGRGRFRDYVKTVLFHLVSNHRRGLQRQLPSLSPDLIRNEPSPTPAE